MTRSVSSSISTPFELNGSSLRALLRDMRDNKIDDQDQRILGIYSKSLVQQMLTPESAAGLTKREAVFRAIEQLWLKRNRPKSLREELVSEWLKFIYPEYLYFYPIRHNTLVSPSIVQASIDLCDPDVVAQIIADGDEREIKRLQSNETSRFFVDSLASEVSLDRTAAKSEKKIDTRVKRLFDDLAALIPSEMDVQAEVMAPLTLPTKVEAIVQSEEPRVIPSIATLPTFSAVQAYQDILDRLYPPLPGYRSPQGRFETLNGSESISVEDAAQHFLEKQAALLITGTTGIGKTTCLTQVFIPRIRKMNCVPVLVPLPDYFDHQPQMGDVAHYVREKVFGHWQPNPAAKDQFADELAHALRDRRVVWLLDGYDELMPRERGLLHQELERLERFVLTTRRVAPELSRLIDATLHLAGISLNQALEVALIRYSPEAQDRLKTWCQRDLEAHQIVESGLLLDEASKLASDSTQPLGLPIVLERAITRQLSTRARFQSKTSLDVYAVARQALTEIAFESLNLHWVPLGQEKDIQRSKLVSAWRTRSTEPEAIFFEVVTSTGLLMEEGEMWLFASDFFRDELASEYLQREGAYALRERWLFPQYERPVSGWTAQLMRDGQHARVITLLETLRKQTDDPYGARWSLIVKILSECLPFDTGNLRPVRLETEQALLDFWQRTSSNNMKMQISLWLLAIQSDKIPDPPQGVIEHADKDIQNSQPGLELSQLLSRAGRPELAQAISDQQRVDQQVVTQALIDVLSTGDRSLVHAAAVFLTQRQLGPTIIEKLKAAGPIDRLVELAKSRPRQNYSTPSDARRTLLAQSAALAVLGRREILADASLLKRIPDDIIHTLMADLHLCVRRRGDWLTVITVDGREWLADRPVT